MATNIIDEIYAGLCGKTPLIGASEKANTDKTFAWYLYIDYIYNKFSPGMNKSSLETHSDYEDAHNIYYDSDHSSINSIYETPLESNSNRNLTSYIFYRQKRSCSQNTLKDISLSIDAMIRRNSKSLYTPSITFKYEV